MVNEIHAPGYVPNPNYSQSDWDEVSEHPELTEAQFRQAQPLREAMPEFVEAVRRRRSLQETSTRKDVALLVDSDVMEAYRAAGPDWRKRMNDALRKAVGL